MISKPFYIKYTIVLVLLMTLLNNGNAQPIYFRGYELNFSNLLSGDLTLVYTQKISRDRYLELSGSFRPQLLKTNDLNLFSDIVRDPCLYYNMYRVKLGVRKYKNEKSYICKMLIFDFGNFNKTEVEVFECDYEKQNIGYTVSRTRFDFGFLLKKGTIIKNSNHYFCETYWGGGLKIKYINESLYANDATGLVGTDLKSPIKNIYFRPMLTIHLGFLIGYHKKG